MRCMSQDDLGYSQNDIGWSQMKLATVAIHEMYKTFVDSGFNEEQALKLVAYLVANSGDADKD